MSSETVGQNGVEYIDLSRSKIVEPLNAYRIHEGNFGIARFFTIRPYLLTVGLSACKGLTFYRADLKVGLCAHISIANEPDRLIHRLVQEFDGNLRTAEVNLITGTHQAKDTDPGFIWGGKWPTLDELISELLKYSPASLRVDRHTHTQQAKGISLDLATGDLREIDSSNGWTWRNQHDTSINRLLGEL